jgi:mRNA interferase MazF
MLQPMNRGEVWWVEFDPAVGSEIRKTRPAVIVSNDAANRNLSRVIVVALTSNIERVYPGNALVTVGSNQSKAMADQMMTADKTRLKSKLGSLSKSDMQLVDDAMSLQLGLRK